MYVYSVLYCRHCIYELYCFLMGFIAFWTCSINLLTYGVSYYGVVCYTIKVRVYYHKIDCPLQLSVSIIGALASLIRLMLRDNAISRLGSFINRLSMQV